jgi:hypothetical protein
MNRRSFLIGLLVAPKVLLAKKKAIPVKGFFYASYIPIFTVFGCRPNENDIAKLQPLDDRKAEVHWEQISPTLYSRDLILSSKVCNLGDK